MNETLALSILRSVIVEVLGFDETDDVNPDLPFIDMGITSLVGVEIADEFGGRIGVPIAVTAAFDYPTCRELARYAADQVARVGMAGNADVTSVATSPPADEEAYLDMAATTGRSARYVEPGTIDDPVVIVGMSCLYPGGVSSPNDLWELVASGRDAIAPFPCDRGWDLDDLVDPDPDSVGHSYVAVGGFLDDVFGFDADFFGISPREAAAMDPQQRLLLEQSWAALEDAGVDPRSLKGSLTSVYVGVATHEYFGMYAGRVPGEAEGYFGTGNAGSVASGRISYALGLEGPSMTVDTACSSSLVALHLAVGALQSGESTLALVGGCTLMPSPIMFVEFSRQRALSPDGRCRSFANSADGTIWAEGVGVVVVERLSEAVRRGHRVRAVVRGMAVNQDGASNGLTAPSGRAQRRVILEALRRAELEVTDVDLVEAHGTGTSLGDPIEAEALLATYGRRADGQAPLYLGSLKSNIGHSQAAAGVGAVIKSVLAIEHGVMPRTLHVDQPSTRVDWCSGAVELLTSTRPWPVREGPRRVGVSAFGISGTNAHAIIEEPPGARGTGQETGAVAQSQRAEGRPLPVLLSAWTPTALKTMAEQWRRALADRLASGDELDLAAISATSIRRAALRHRAGIVAANGSELLEALEALMRSEGHSNLVTGRSADRRVAFVFPGQGSQWKGMLSELYGADAQFREIVHEVASAVDSHTGWSAVDALLERAQGLDPTRVDVVQPLLFVAMVSLAQFWRAWGVAPDAVIGQSQGELAAAAVAGALPTEEAARILVARAHLIGSITERGAMGWAAVPELEVADYLATEDMSVWVAGVNGPRSTVIAGDPDAVDRALDHFEGTGAWTRRILVTYASHTPNVEEVREAMLERIGEVSYCATRTPMWSTVRGRLVQPDELNADYWFANLRLPVRFDSTLRQLLAADFRALIEVSPHTVLATSMESIIESQGKTDVAVITTLARDDGDIRRFLLAATHAQAVGLPVRFNGPSAGQVTLPTYPFQHQRHALPAPTGHQSIGHPLVAERHELAESDDWLVTSSLATSTLPWLRDHTVLEQILVSGTTVVDLLLAAAETVGAETIDELTLETPIVLRDGTTTKLQTWLRHNGSDVWSVDVFGRTHEDDAWVRHATGALSVKDESVPRLAATNTEPGESLDVDELYDRLEAVGVSYGTTFRALRSATRCGDMVTGTVALEGAGSGHLIHPALLDACFHAAVLLTDENDPESALMLPYAWRGVTIHQAGETELDFELMATAPGAFAMVARNSVGLPVVTVSEVVARPVSREQLRSLDQGVRDLYVMEWSEVPVGSASDEGGLIELVVDLGEVEAEIRRCLDGVPTHKSPVAVALRLRAGDDPASLTDQLDDMVRGLQMWLGHPSTARVQLAICTYRATTGSCAGPNLAPAEAAVWGLVRSAQSEHPGRMVLIDGVRGDIDIRSGLATLLAADEPQGAVSDGKILVPRLSRITGTSALPTLRTDGAFVITGGTTGVGLALAKHLAEQHGVPHLVLLSRRGEATPDLHEAISVLRDRGVRIDVHAVDVTDLDALSAIVKSVDAEVPIRGMVHSAGVLRDSLFTALTREDLQAVIAPKVSPAVHMAQLAADLDLDTFVICSSLAGVVGGPGQANYAAANAYIDAVAESIPVATSIAWGLWDQPSTMVGTMGDGGIDRLRAFGLEAMSIDHALALFDAALGLNVSLVVAAALDHQRLHESARAGMLPSLLDRLVRSPGRGRSAVRTLDLSTVPPEQIDDVVLSVVASHTAAALGHTGDYLVDLDLGFKDLGFDSLAGVRLRNQLSGTLGRQLPSTLVFDYPTPRKLAVHLAGEVRPSTVEDPDTPFAAVLQQLETAFATAEGDQRELLRTEISRLLDRDTPIDDIDDRIENADADALLQLIDESIL